MIFITGASGFIGRNLVKYLTQVKKKKVVCFVRSRFNLPEFDNPLVKVFKGSMTDFESIRKASKGCKTVIHLAAATSEKASDYRNSYDVNVTGAKNLISACRANKIKRIIYISTQSTKRKKRGVYAETKKLSDKIFLKADLDVTILKPTLVYGKDAKGLFSKILGFVEKLPIIPIIGSGNYKNQPVYVEDVCVAINSCVENKETVGRIYDIAGANRLGFEKFLDIIMDELNIKKKKIHIPYFLVYSGISILSLLTKKLPVTKDNLLGLIQETKINLDPAHRDFNYKPSTIREGLRKSFYSTKGLKAVVVGMGKMGIVHATILNKVKGVDVVAIMDKNTKLRTYLRTIGIKGVFFDDTDKMISRVKPDVAFICTPPFLTHRIVNEFASKNIHVFSEKPMADSLEHAKEIVKVVNKNKVSYNIGYHINHTALMQKTSSLLKEKVIGDVKEFSSQIFLSQVFSKKKGWRYNKKTSGGGVTIILASHLLYAIHTLFGKVKSVDAKCIKLFSDVEDESKTKFEFTSGVKGSLYASWSKKGYESVWYNIFIRGTNGSLILNNEEIVIDVVKKKGKYSSGKHIIHKSDVVSNEKFQVGGEGYFSEDEDFIKLISSKNKNNALASALETQKLLEAIYDSSAKKKKVNMK